MQDPKAQHKQDDSEKDDSENEQEPSHDTDEENEASEDKNEAKDVTMLDMSQWLSTLGLEEKYGKKFEEEQYTTMDKIMELNKSQIAMMLKVTGVDDSDAETKILPSLEAIQGINKWKKALCGEWSNDMNDEIKIRTNNKRKLVVDMHCVGKPKLTGFISISRNNYFLHYDDYPGVFGQLSQESTLESDCAILIWYHDRKYTRWYSVNDEIEEVGKWLSSLGLGKYQKIFQANKYTSMSMIKSFNKSKVDDMLKVVGCKQGSSLKIQYSLGVISKEKKEVFDPYAAAHWNSEIKQAKTAAHFESLGGDSYNEGDFPRATFWFFQHKVHELGGSEYQNVELASSKCPPDWSGFLKFLVEEFREGNIRQSTAWGEISAKYKKFIAPPESGGFGEVFEWLNSMRLEKYASSFEEEEYDSMELIKGLSESQVDEMIKLVGCKGGAAAKIQQSLVGGTSRPKKKWVNFDPDNRLRVKERHEPSAQKWEKWEKSSNKEQKEPAKDKDGKPFDPYNSDYWKNFDSKKSVLEPKPQKRQDYEGAPVREEQRPVQKEHKVYEWLQNLELEHYHRKFEEEGYDKMDKLVGLEKEQIRKLLDDIEATSSDSAKIAQSLATMRHLRFIKIKHKHGVEVVTKPEYPGVCIGERLAYNQIVPYFETERLDYLGYVITCYKLADGRGWAHNFIASSPGSHDKIIQELIKVKNDDKKGKEKQKSAEKVKT